jgi:mRNA interferase MazF
MILENVIKLLEWCKIKILLSERSPNILFKEGEIWWCRIGMNVGHETYGKGVSFARPVLIYKKFSADFFIGIPMTSKKKEGTWFVPLVFNGKENCIILSQLRSFDGIRPIERIGVLSDAQYEGVKIALHELLYGYGQMYLPPCDGVSGKSQM